MGNWVLNVYPVTIDRDQGRQENRLLFQWLWFNGTGTINVDYLPPVAQETESVVVQMYQSQFSYPQGLPGSSIVNVVPLSSYSGDATLRISGRRGPRSEGSGIHYDQTVSLTQDPSGNFWGWTVEGLTHIATYAFEMSVMVNSTEYPVDPEMIVGEKGGEVFGGGGG